MDKRITIIGGAYGSGKTEFSIAYALTKKDQGFHVGLADLDIVNPYFRSRDQADNLANQGITVVSTEPGLENSDIPAISPRVYALLQDPAYQKVLLDVGGDPVGARALGRFNPYFAKAAYDFWLVINPFRPGTRNLEETLKLVAELQSTSRLQVTGIISNINLGRETTVELWRDGLSLVKAYSAALQLPILYQMLTKDFYRFHSNLFKDYPIFQVELQMRPAWFDEL